MFQNFVLKVVFLSGDGTFARLLSNGPYRTSVCVRTCVSRVKEKINRTYVEIHKLPLSPNFKQAPTSAKTNFFINF